MTNFHNKYKTLTPWWKVINAEFQLIEDYEAHTPVFGFCYADKWVCLSPNGHLKISRDVKWSASGPTWDTKNSREPTLIHDIFYYLAQKGVFNGPQNLHVKKIVDKYMYTMLIQNGMFKFRAKIWYTAVDKRGHTRWKI